MKNALFIVLILGLVAGGGWWFVSARDARHANMVTMENAATEALLQAIIRENDAPQPKFYFVGFGTPPTDPSRLFLARFATHVPPVRGTSSATTVRNGLVQETASGRTGVVIQVIYFKKIKAGTFDLQVRFPKLATGPNQFTYRMIQNGTEWGIKYKVPSR